MGPDPRRIPLTEILDPPLISLWHRKFVAADVTAVFVNNQQGIQRRGQGFDKNT